MKRRSLFDSFLIYLGAALVVFVTIAPPVWLIISSISTQNELLSVPVHWIPQEPTFARYIEIITATGDSQAAVFRKAMLNSIIIAASVTLICVGVGSLAAYSFARMRFAKHEPFMYLMLFSYMLPPIMIVVPLYTIMRDLVLLGYDPGAGGGIRRADHAICGVDHARLFPEHPARPGGRGRHRWLHPPGRAVPGGLSALRAGAGGYLAVLLPGFLGRVPDRADLHLQPGRQDHPGGDCRVHRPARHRLWHDGDRRRDRRHPAHFDRAAVPALSDQRVDLGSSEGVICIDNIYT